MPAMVPYEVWDKAGGDRFYVLADSTGSAIEAVDRALAGRTGASTWDARQASPALTLVRDVVFDASGRPI